MSYVILFPIDSFYYTNRQRKTINFLFLYFTFNIFETIRIKYSFRENLRMIFDLLNIDIISSLFGFILGLFSYWLISRRYHHVEKVVKLSDENEFLHWNPSVERRGLGDLIKKVNHIAITVSDVGKSLGFYVDILGLQQIRRPTFDRHGAWLTMGNIELHLIKGIPAIPPFDNLQTSHIALETPNLDQVVEKLHRLNIDIRQSFNVTNAHQSNKSRITQYFFKDPDGYYLELCNCDVLTDFAFYKNIFIEPTDYHEGLHPETIFHIAQIASHWKTLGLHGHSDEEFQNILNETTPADHIDEEKFDNIRRRRSVYGDLIQGFTDEDIKQALIQTNNNIPLMIKYLEIQRGKTYFFQPVTFIENNDKVVEPEPFTVNQKNSK